MMRGLLAGLAGLVLIPAGAAQSSSALPTGGPLPPTIDGGRYGEVRLVVPRGRATAYVVYFSGQGGWHTVDQAALDAIAGAGAIAIGVDLDSYYHNVGADPYAKRRRCDVLVGDVEGLSRQLQHRLQADTYYFPILAGAGEGGALALQVLGQAPDNTLAGAIALDSPAITHPPVRLCKGPFGAPFGFHEKATRNKMVANDMATSLVALLQPHIGVPNADGVSALPLEELPSAPPGQLLAVVLSGDGGWRDLDRTIAENLQHGGVSVVGWDSLRYFWRERTPQETAADLSKALRYYSVRWHTEQIALIGYSFGADVLPAVYAQLPEDLRSHVVLVSLLALSPKADWEISVTGWLGAPPTSKARPIAQDLAAVPPGIVQCIYGAEEIDSPCPGLANTDAEIVRTLGGHHFDRKYDALAERILRKFRRGMQMQNAMTAPSLP